MVEIIEGNVVAMSDLLAKLQAIKPIAPGEKTEAKTTEIYLSVLDPEEARLRAIFTDGARAKIDGASNELVASGEISETEKEALMKAVDVVMSDHIGGAVDSLVMAIDDRLRGRTKEAEEKAKTYKKVLEMFEPELTDYEKTLLNTRQYADEKLQPPRGWSSHDAVSTFGVYQPPEDKIYLRDAVKAIDKMIVPKT